MASYTNFFNIRLNVLSSLIEFIASLVEMLLSLILNCLMPALYKFHSTDTILRVIAHKHVMCLAYDTDILRMLVYIWQSYSKRSSL